MAAAAGATFARAEPTFYTARVAPIFEKHCVGCHGPDKKKAGLRLDSFENVMRGAESGDVVTSGDPKKSELYRRVTLPETDDEVMPSDGKPHLARDEIRILEIWIAAGAAADKPLSEFPDAPAPKPVVAQVPLAPDWRPRAAEIAAVAKAAGVKLVPRSQIATDGLVLRTASAPARCDDGALEKLSPVADLIVDAELARTKVTDAGLKAIGACQNLRSLDLTRTAVSSAGLAALASLQHLEAINLTETRVDDGGVERLKALPELKQVWVFGTKVSTPAEPAKVVAK